MSRRPRHTLFITLLVLLMDAVLIASLAVERFTPRGSTQHSRAAKHGDLQAQRTEGAPLQTQLQLVHEEVASAEEFGRPSTAALSHVAVTHAPISLHSDSNSPPFSYLEQEEKEQRSNNLFWAVIADLLTVFILIVTIPFMLSMARGQGWKFWKNDETPPSRFPTVNHINRRNTDRRRRREYALR